MAAAGVAAAVAAVAAASESDSDADLEEADREEGLVDAPADGEDDAASVLSTALLSTVIVLYHKLYKHFL